MGRPRGTRFGKKAVKKEILHLGTGKYYAEIRKPNYEFIDSGFFDTKEEAEEWLRKRKK